MSSLLSVLRIPHLRTVADLGRDLRAYVRLSFLFAASDSGVLRALRTPSTLDEVVASVGATRPDLLETLLGLGVALGELARDGGSYSLRGRRARVLAQDSGDPLAAWVEENLGYHGDVYRSFSRRMRGEAPGRYLDIHAQLIARSSRVLEPLQAAFVRDLVRRRRPARLLEVGCGSGIYLRHAAEASPALTGVAIDVQEKVVADARASLAAWGLAERFELCVGDVLAPPPSVAGPFDLVTMYNNVYYFDDGIRVDLFRKVRRWLSAGGAFALTSAFQGDTPEMHGFDLALRCTAGCTPLPVLTRVTAQLREAGFGKVEAVTLGPAGSFHGVVASG